jgi:hypothetical protein
MLTKNSQRINYVFASELIDFAPGFSFVQKPQEFPPSPDWALLLSVETCQPPICIESTVLQWAGSEALQDRFS